MPAETRRPPRAQADRRAETHAALLAAAARGLSRYGYGNLNLAEVAAEAGYTRGALYHLFDDKEDLALAVVAWVWETWQQQVTPLAEAHDEPFQALVALARGHVAYCRDGRARVMMTLRVELAYLSALEGLAIGVAGRTPHDEALAERMVVGLLRGGAP